MAAEGPGDGETVKRGASKGSRTSSRRESRGGILKLIAVFKLVKAILLIATGLAALHLLNPETAEQLRRWLATLTWRADHRVVSLIEDRILHLQASRLVLVAIAAFLYAALFVVEGIGLWSGYRWAEFLTIIATSSFVPFEIYELTRHVSWPRVTTLAINLVVVGYLVWKVRHRDG